MLKILLVEDSEDDAFFFQNALRKSQIACECEHVLDGKQAVSFLETCREKGEFPDLVFLDLKLPIMTGFEVLKWVEQQRFQPRLNIIVLSGSDHHADVKLARELGAADYVMKPISPDDCRQRLTGVVPRIATSASSPSVAKAAA